MSSRIQGLRQRLTEAARFTRATSGLAYLGAWYGGRLRSRVPLLPELILPVTIRSGNGTVRLWLRANGADPTVFRGVFLEQEYQLPADIQPHTILDVGGNCGFASVYLWTRYPEADLVSLEPLQRNIDAWKRNVERSGCKARLLEAALGVADGTATFYLTGNDSCESLEPIHAWRERTVVETVCMDTLLDRLRWEKVDLLKLDIEGYEKELLSGGPKWLERVETIVAELHGQYGLAELQQDLAPHGFVIANLSSGYETTYLARRTR